MGEERSEVWESGQEARSQIDFVCSIFASPNMRLCLQATDPMWLRWGIHKFKRALYAGGKLSAPAEHSNVPPCLQLSSTCLRRPCLEHLLCEGGLYIQRWRRF
jgi:hypothetical protein